MEFTAAEIARHLGGEVIGNGATILTGFSPATTAKSGDLTFAENETYFGKAEQSAAAAILVDGDFVSPKKALVKVANARIAFAKVLSLFFPEPVLAPQVHPSAVIDPSAVVDPSAHIGPLCLVGNGVRIGARVVLRGAVNVAAGCVVGDDSHLFPNVTLYEKTQLGQRVRIHSGSVIGADGFGYVLDQGSHRKVPQIGTVIVHDDVEIGANVTIDRGALGPTIIGRGTKIDNLVQIAHNVVIGEHCLIISQAGVAGSTKLGNYVIVAAQAGVAGHLKIGNKVTILAQSGVMTDIPEGEKWLGAPAQPDRQAKRMMIAMQQLPDLIRRFKEMEKRLSDRPPTSPRAGS